MIWALRSCTLGTDCSGFLCPNEAVFELRDVLEDAEGKTVGFVQRSAYKGAEKLTWKVVSLPR